MTRAVEHHGSFEKPKKAANGSGGSEPIEAVTPSTPAEKAPPILEAVTLEPSNLDASLNAIAEGMGKQGAMIEELMAKVDRWEQDFRPLAEKLSNGPIRLTQTVQNVVEIGDSRPFTGIIGGNTDFPAAPLARRSTFRETLLRLLDPLRGAGATSRPPRLGLDQKNGRGSGHSGTWRKPRFVIYTSITGNYDELKLPQKVSKDFDYVCFTESKPRRAGVWAIRQFDFIHEDPVRTARFVKLHPHIYFPDYEASIWIDGHLLIKGDISEFLQSLEGQSKIAAFIHPHRNCIYDEAQEVIARGNLDRPDLINRQMQTYESRKYPKKFGLVETGTLARRHNDPQIIQLMNAWWKEIDNGSRRDQLSLPFVCNELRIPITPLASRGISVRNDARIRWVLHGKQAKYSAPRRLRRMKPRDGIQEVRRADGNPILPARAITTDEASIRGLSLDVVVCVYNAVEYVKECLESVASTMLPYHGIIIVDDGSDSETQNYLRRFVARTPNSRIIRHEDSGGYTRAVNAGVRASKADYAILLNSDTVVPPRWWIKLLEVAESADDIGIVGPMSNAASWQSLPEILTADGKLAVNEIPEGLSTLEMDDLLVSCSTTNFPRVPLLNGFCLAIKRKVFAEIGEFDEKSFPRGYGEEDDFCFRAADAGFGLAVATHCYVYHAKSKSYSSAGRDEIAKDSSKAFRSKYAKYRIDSAIKTMKLNPLLNRMRERFGQKLDVRAGKAPANGAASSGEVLSASDSDHTFEPFGLSKGGNRAEVIPGFDPSLMITLRPKAKTREEALAFDLTSEQVEANRRIVQEFRANPTVTPHRVLWFVPKFDNIIRGGIRTIFATAESFSRRWETHNIFVAYGGQMDLDRMKRDARRTFPDLRFEFIELDNGDDPDDLPESDVAFCTLWTSAYLLVKYNRCRSKCYFVQDYEPVFHAAGTTFGFAQQSYRFGFTGIANTPGVADHYARFDPWVKAFTPAVDRSIFYPEARSDAPSRPFRVVFYGRPDKARNAFHLGAEALRQVKHRLGDKVEIISVGSKFDTKAHGLDGVLENWGMLMTMEEVAQLYRTSDVGLVFMFSAHPSYQPFEFMASGCATVSNFNPANEWLFKNNENMVLTDAVPGCVAENIIRLLEDSEFRTKIARGGFDTVERFDWENSFREIQDYVANPYPRAKIGN